MSDLWYPVGDADTRTRTPVSFPVQVTLLEALAEQPRINGPSTKRKQEHITISPLLWRRLGRPRLPMNLRVDYGGGVQKAVTLEQVWREADDNQFIMRMHAEGLEECGLVPANLPMTVTIVSDTVPHQTYTEAQAESFGDFVEFYEAGGTEIAAIAPHGGRIERYTDLQARHVKTHLAGTRNVMAWGAVGFSVNSPTQNASDRWHLTAENMYPEGFPLLANIFPANRHEGPYQWVVGFHGYTSTNVINLGGLAPLADLQQLESDLQAALPSTTVQITDLDHIDGDAPGNIMNRLADANKYTIQLEQSLDIRGTDWDTIAEVVADFISGKLP